MLLRRNLLSLLTLLQVFSHERVTPRRVSGMARSCLPISHCARCNRHVVSTQPAAKRWVRVRSSATLQKALSHPEHWIAGAGYLATLFPFAVSVYRLPLFRGT
jgi:hypothetical protein